MYGLKVPVKELGMMQKKLGDNMLIVPKLKNMKVIENDPSHKIMLLKEKPSDSFSYDLTEEKVTLGYDNLSISK